MRRISDGGGPPCYGVGFLILLRQTKIISKQTVERRWSAALPTVDLNKSVPKPIGLGTRYYIRTCLRQNLVIRFTHNNQNAERFPTFLIPH